VFGVKLSAFESDALFEVFDDDGSQSSLSLLLSISLSFPSLIPLFSPLVSSVSRTPPNAIPQLS
jgi:hypothetical protein